MGRIDDRRRRVAQLRREGSSHRAIAEELHVSHVTVIRDCRAIEERTGESLTDYVTGEDGKYYAPKVTYQEYEGEDWFDQKPDEGHMSAGDHLNNAVAHLQQAQDELNRIGVRDGTVPALLAEVRLEAKHTLDVNKALPRQH